MTYTPSTERREASCRARDVLLSAAPEQIDDWRLSGESRAKCVDRLLSVLAKHPFEALAYMGAH